MLRSHRHTALVLRGSWHCSRTAALAGCHRAGTHCRPRPPAGHTPGSTRRCPAPAERRWDSVAWWGSTGMFHCTAGSTPEWEPERVNKTGTADGQFGLELLSVERTGSHETCDAEVSQVYILERQFPTKSEYRGRRTDFLLTCRAVFGVEFKWTVLRCLFSLFPSYCYIRTTWRFACGLTLILAMRSWLLS